MEQVRYIAVDSTALDLTAYQEYFLRARRGWDAPPVQLHSERIPNLPGARRTSLSVRERAVAFTMDVNAAGWDDARARLGTLVPLLMQGGSLEVTVNSRTRRLDVTYAGGLDGETVFRGPSRFTLVPEFRALWPYWYDTTPQSSTVDLATAGAGVAFPLTFPIFFEAVGTAKKFDLTGGDVAGPFAVAINGPFGRVQLARLDTNEVLDVTYAVGAGSVLRIDTTPGLRRVTVDSGAGIQVARGALSSQSTFWQLGPGLTPCALVVDQANRMATFEWRNYYRTSN